MAGKSTLNRLELTPVGADEQSRYKKITCRTRDVEQLFVTLFLQAGTRPPARIVRARDAPDDPIHGPQAVGSRKGTASSRHGIHQPRVPRLLQPQIVQHTPHQRRQIGQMPSLLVAHPDPRQRQLQPRHGLQHGQPQSLIRPPPRNADIKNRQPVAPLLLPTPHQHLAQRQHPQRQQQQEAQAHDLVIATHKPRADPQPSGAAFSRWKSRSRHQPPR